MDLQIAHVTTRTVTWARKDSEMNVDGVASSQEAIGVFRGSYEDGRDRIEASERSVAGL